MVDEITDDLKDTQDITKAISELMSGDLQSAADGVGDKVREIQDALADAQITGSELKIEDTTFKNLASLISESQNAIQSTAQGASIFAEKLEDIADHQELINTISQGSAAIAQDQIDYQNQLANTTGLTAGEVRKIQIEIGKLDQMADFLKSVEASVGATNNLASAQAEVAKQTQQFIDKQKASAISVGNTLKTVKDLDKEVANVNNTSNSLSGSMSGFGSPEPLEWDTTALDDAYDRFREIQDNIRNGDMAANIEITGNNEMEKLISDLTAAQAAADRLTRHSLEFADQLSTATDKSSALKVIQQERSLAEKAITELQEQIPDRANEVALLERSLAVETAKLKILPEGTTEYNIQKELFEQVEASHIRASAGLKAVQSEVEQLTSFKDDYLGKQQEDIKNSKDIEATLQKSLSDTTTLASSSAIYSSQLGEAANNAKKYGNNFKGLAEQLGPTFDSAIDGIKSAKESVLGLAGSIPIFGGMIQKNLEGPFNKATDIISDGIGEGLNIMKAQLADNKSVTEAMSAGFGHMGKAIKDAGAMLKVAFSGPMLLIGSILLLIGMAVKRFFELDDASQEFRKGLGLAAKQTSKLEKEAAGVQRELAGFGVSIEDAFESLTAMTEVMGVTALVTKEQVKLITMLNKGMGISAHTGAEVYETFKLLSGGSSDTAKNLTLVTTQLAAAAGVPLGKVMEDVANASDTVMTMSRGTGKELAVAAVEARRLGTNIESISSAMENQLDFETSIQNEMRMASMLGKHISMDAMRRASFEGDQVKYMAEQKKVMSQLGDLTKMNAYQRKAVADAMGIEVGELMKMQTQEKQLEALRTGTSEQRKALAEYEKMRDQALQGQTKSLAEQGMEMLKQQQAENVRTRLANAFNELMTELGSVLLPVVESAMNVLVPIVSNLIRGFAKVVKVVELLMQPFIFIGNVISAITGDTEGLQKQFDGLGKTLFAIGGILLGGLVMFATKVTSIGGLFTSIFSIAGKAGSTVFGKLASGITSIFSAGTEASDGFFSGVTDKLKGMAGGIKDKLGDKIGGLFGKSDVTGPLKKDGTPDMRFKANKKPGVPDLSTDSLPDVDADKSSKLASFVENFNKIDMRKVIQAAAALAILSGALFVTAKALKEFNKVDWSSLVKGTLALGMLVGGLYGLSKVLSATKASLIQGAAAMFILGSALIPAAFAFKMFADVDWTAMLLAGVALVALGAAAFFLGGIAPLIFAGSLAIAALGASLIPFGIAALMAGAGMLMLGKGLSMTMAALGEVGFSTAMQIGILATAIAGLGILSPVMVIVGAGLMVFSAALVVAGAAVTIFGAGLGLVVESLKQLPEASLGLLAFGTALAFLAPLTPLILLTAASLGVMSLALIPLALASIPAGAGLMLMANALATISDADATSTIMNLVGAFFALGASLPIIALGVVSLSLITLALLPFSLAMGAAGLAMMAFGTGLSLTTSALQALGDGSEQLVRFGVAVSILGTMMPLIVLGAVSMGVLAAALIPLGIATLIAGPGLIMVSYAFSILSKSLKRLEVGPLFSLMGAFTLMGASIGFILLGAVALAAMSAALIPFGIAAMVAGAGMALFAGAFSLFATSMSMIPDGVTGTLIGIGIGMLFLSGTILAAIGATATLAIMAAGLFAFGIAATIAAVATNALGLGLVLIAVGLQSIAKTGATAIQNLALLGLVAPLLFVAAAGIGALAVAMVAMGAATAAAGILSIFAKDDPFEVYVRLGQNAETLGQAADGLKKIGESMALLSDTDAEDILEDMGDGFEELFDEIEDFEPETITKFATIGTAFAPLGDAFSNITPGIKPLRELLKMVSEQATFDTAITGFDMLSAAILRFGEALRLTNPALTGMSSALNISSQINEKTINQATGEEQPINKLQKNTNAEVTQNTSVGVKPKPGVHDAQKHFDKIFMTRVGGEDKFNQYMDNKKAHEAANKELSAFRTENESSKITEQREDEFGMMEDVTVGYKGEDKNQKYQELLAKWSETGDTVDNSKRGLKNEYIKNTARSDSSFAQNMAGRKFDTALTVQENQIPQDYSKSVSGNMVKESLSGSINLGKQLPFETIGSTDTEAVNQTTGETQPIDQLQQNTEAIQKNTEAMSQTTGDGQSIDKLQKDKLDENKEDSSFLFGIPSAIGDFFDGIFGSKPNEEETQPIDKLQKNTNVEVAQNTSVGVKPTTKFTESKKALDDIFYEKVGGEDKFKQYMENKKAYETASSELHNFQAENKSSKVVEQIDDDFDGTIDSIVGYGDEDKNKKYQELLSKEDATRRTKNESRSGLKKEYMENSLGSSYSTTQQNKAHMLFDMHLMKRENQIPMDHSKSVNEGITTETSSGKLSLGKQLPFETSGSMNVNNQIQEKSELESTNTNIPTGVSSEEMASGGADIPSLSMPDVVQQVASVPPPTPMQKTSSDDKGVEAKLDELINLMKSGGIAVNMDGKKVSTQLAKASP